MKVSGTIILGENEKNMFLVLKDIPYSFPSIDDNDETKTALGGILDYYKKEMNVEPDALRLEELSMVKKGNSKQNLFVFSIHDDVKRVKQACLATQKLKFVDVAELQSLFDTVEMDTAPFFE